MAITNVYATGGAVSLPSGFVGKFRSFDWDFALPEVDVTGFGDGGVAVFDPAGGIRLTGTVQGILQFDAAALNPIPTTLSTGSALAYTAFAGQYGTTTLTYQTGCTLAATCIISSVSGNRAEVGSGTANWRFGSRGQITQVWDVT